MRRDRAGARTRARSSGSGGSSKPRRVRASLGRVVCCAEDFDAIATPIELHTLGTVGSKVEPYCTKRWHRTELLAVGRMRYEVHVYTTAWRASNRGFELPRLPARAMTRWSSMYTSGTRRASRTGYRPCCISQRWRRAALRARRSVCVHISPGALLCNRARESVPSLSPIERPSSGRPHCTAGVSSCTARR